jgi:hypothetical protein
MYYYWQISLLQTAPLQNFGGFLMAMALAEGIILIVQTIFVSEFFFDILRS